MGMDFGAQVVPGVRSRSQAGSAELRSMVGTAKFPIQVEGKFLPAVQVTGIPCSQTGHFEFQLLVEIVFQLWTSSVLLDPV